MRNSTGIARTGGKFCETEFKPRASSFAEYPGVSVPGECAKASDFLSVVLISQRDV